MKLEKQFLSQESRHTGVLMRWDIMDQEIISLYAFNIISYSTLTLHSNIIASLGICT